MPHIDTDNDVTGLEAEERMVEVDAVIMLAAFLLIGFLAFSFCGCRRGEALPLAEGLTPKKGTDGGGGNGSPRALHRARTASTLARGASSMLKPHEVMANDHGAAPSRSIAGVYECHDAALLSQDDVSIDATGWRHVTVEPCGGRRRYGSEFRWKTRSGKQWTLSPMHEAGALQLKWRASTPPTRLAGGHALQRGSLDAIDVRTEQVEVTEGDGGCDEQVVALASGGACSAS